MDPRTCDDGVATFRTKNKDKLLFRMAFSTVRGTPMVRKALILVGSLGLFIAPAVADADLAILQTFKGKVLVNQGLGFQTTMVGTTLKIGDQILIGKAGTAVVSFNNGCEITVSEPKVFVVPKTAPCKAGEKIADIADGFVAPVAGGGGGSIPPPVIGVGAFAAALGTAVIFDATQKTTPVSP